MVSPAGTLILDALGRMGDGWITKTATPINEEERTMNTSEGPRESSFDQLWERLPPDAKLGVSRPNTVRQAPPGALNNYDICILLGEDNWAGMDPHAATTRARDLVRDLNAPLVEVGNGRWVVKYLYSES